jgi:hypothetical protein
LHDERLKKMALHRLRRFSFGVLSFWLALVGSPSLAGAICQHGDRNVHMTLLPPSGAPLSLTVGSGYFDQRFVPADGGTREGLLLFMQATDFAPWPRGLRPHPSEGPLMMYLLTPFLPFDVVADRKIRMENGFDFSEKMSWSDSHGAFGLIVPLAPPLPAGRRSGLMGQNDIYIARDRAGAITDIISCLRPGRSPFQSCNHMIEAGDMDIQLTYAPEFLPEWQRLSVGAKDFLTCMMKG